MDIDRTLELRDSLNLKIGGLPRRKVQRGELPPLLSDMSNNAVSFLYDWLSFNTFIWHPQLAVQCELTITIAETCLLRLIFGFLVDNVDVDVGIDCLMHRATVAAHREGTQPPTCILLSPSARCTSPSPTSPRAS